MALCPFCNHEVTFDEIVTERAGMFYSTATVMMYSCPHCRRILGITAAK